MSSTLAAALSPLAQFRVRRLAAAIAVLAIHAVAVGELLLMQRYFSLQRPEPDRPGLSWVLLPHPSEPEPAPIAPRPSRTVSPALHPPARNDDKPVNIVPPTITPSPSLPDALILRGLGNALSCSLMTYGQLPAEEKARCERRLGAMQHESAPAYAPTVREALDQAKFARALAIKKAPLLLPCFGPRGGISVLCLVDGAVNGFTFDNAGYADEDARRR